MTLRAAIFTSSGAFDVMGQKHVVETTNHILKHAVFDG